MARGIQGFVKHATSGLRQRASASSQAANRVRLQVELLESRFLLSHFVAGQVKLGSLVQVSSTSPFANNNNDNVPGQPGTNYLHSEVEPSIATDPNNPKHLVGVWQQDRWSNSGARGIVSGVSYDGGNTWTLNPVPGTSLVTNGTMERVTDPWVSFAADGSVYLAVSPFDITFDFNQGMFVYKSTNGGQTWSGPTTLIFETIPNAIDDKESVTGDPTNSQYAYYTWDRLFFDPNTFAFINGPTWFTRTTDGGQTWEPARIIFDGGTNTQTIGNQIVVLPNGTLVDFFTFLDFNTGAENVELIRSTDHGATWSGPTTVGAIERVNPFDPNNGQPLRTGEDLPAVAVNSHNGALYAVWVDARFNGFQYNATAFSQSTDGGLTWSAPIQVNKTPTNIPLGNQQTITPNVAVANNGTVGVTYFDFRNPDNIASGLPTDYWIVFGPGNQNLTNPSNWGGEQRMTDASFNIELAPFDNGYFLGDYMSLTAGGHDPNSFGALFTQAVSTADPTSEFFRYAKPTGNAGDSAIPANLLSASPTGLIGESNQGAESTMPVSAGLTLLSQDLQESNATLAYPVRGGDTGSALAHHLLMSNRESLVTDLDELFAMDTGAWV
jgi:hypothetical protein